LTEVTRVCFAEQSVEIFKDAKGEGKETFSANKFPILLRGCWNAFYIRGAFQILKLFLQAISMLPSKGYSLA